MNQLNSIIVEGNLVQDPESRLTPRGTPLCQFVIATNRYFKQDGVRNSEVSYFDVEVWSKVAESCEKYLNKGRGVRVVGRLKQDRWTDDAGKSRTKIKIVGEHVEFKPQVLGNDADEAAVDEPSGQEVKEAMEAL